jgi:hypothetical protein
LKIGPPVKSYEPKYVYCCKSTCIYFFGLKAS